MNTLIKKVLEYQKNKNEIVFEEIINILTPVINILLKSNIKQPKKLKLN